MIVFGARLAAVAIATLGCLASACGQDDEAEGVHVSTSSADFIQSLNTSMEELRAQGFAENLARGDRVHNLVSDGEFEARVQNIIAEPPLANVALGNAETTYDVILQPGHYGRTSGRVGTSGALVSERALASYIVGKTAERLQADGLTVLVVSADNYLLDDPATPAYDGLRTLAFLSVHADGSVHPCSTGPSLAYEADSDLMGMHAIGYGLSMALGYDYGQFNSDNFTANERGYYMFRRVQSARLKGLLEVGELTCPASEERLVDSADELSANLAQALEYIVRARAH